MITFPLLQPQNIYFNRKGVLKCGWDLYQVVDGMTTNVHKERLSHAMSDARIFTLAALLQAT